MTTRTLDASLLATLPIEWLETEGDVDFPYEAKVDGIHFRIRINDFPDEPLFSLMQEGTHIADFDDWPDIWKR